MKQDIVEEATAQRVRDDTSKLPTSQPTSNIPKDEKKPNHLEELQMKREVTEQAGRGEAQRE